MVVVQPKSVTRFAYRNPNDVGNIIGERRVTMTSAKDNLKEWSEIESKRGSGKAYTNSKETSNQSDPTSSSRMELLGGAHWRKAKEKYRCCQPWVV